MTCSHTCVGGTGLRSGFRASHRVFQDCRLPTKRACPDELSGRWPVQKYLHVSASQGASTNSSATGRVYPVPGDAAETAEQALGAVQRAWAAGIKRQRLELLLPLIGATDLDDWVCAGPGGVRQQFKAALPMVETILKGLKQTPGLEGPLTADIWDQGDAVGAWTGEKLAAIVFPTGETLKRVKEVASKREAGLTFLVNPQWQGGQIVSDFGLGPWRRASEEFVQSFQDTYFLKTYRISGDTVRVLRAYPGTWQVHAVGPQGETELLASLEAKPSYQELATLLLATPGSNSSKGWVQRLQDEIAFNQRSMKGPQ